MHSIIQCINTNKEILLKNTAYMLVEDRLERAKQLPLRLFTISIFVDKYSTFEALYKFVENFDYIETLPPDKYTKDFCPIDHSFLSTSYQLGDIFMKPNDVITASEERKKIYFKSIKDYVSINWSDVLQYAFANVSKNIMNEWMNLFSN